MSEHTFREATIADVEDLARLKFVEGSSSWQNLLETFDHELRYCESHPEERTYYLAYERDELVSYGGARYYDRDRHENMYGTSELLPTGWYLRGIRVHPDWRRKGLARQMTLKRLDWLSRRASECYVFMDDETKVTVPMYRELGFVEHSRGWSYVDPARVAKKIRGLLLSLDFPRTA